MMNFDELIRATGLEIIQKEKAEGGSAIIHKAKVIEPSFANVGDIVAVKQYKPDMLRNNQFARIQQEANLCAKIKNSNFVVSYGLFGEPDSCVILVMEWLDGSQLDKWINDRKDLDNWDNIQKMIISLISAVEALHDVEVMHRDIKTENIMIDSAGNVKLMDLGIAEQITEDADTMHTQVKDFIGSIRFASPQFVSGEPFKPADDVYALGTVIFELLTGKRVYEDVERKTLLTHEILLHQPTIPDLLPSIPPPMRTVLQGMLNPERSRRPTLIELRSAIEKPDNAEYIQRELEAQSKEQRGYEVILVDKNSLSVHADLRGESPQIDSIWSGVRRGEAVKVPSRGGSVSTENWIAYVKLKHIYNGVGQFVTVTKQWKSTSDFAGISSALRSISGGYHEYEEDDAKQGGVNVGDIVIKER